MLISESPYIPKAQFLMKERISWIWSLEWGVFPCSSTAVVNTEDLPQAKGPWAINEQQPLSLSFQLAHQLAKRPPRCTDHLLLWPADEHRWHRELTLTPTLLSTLQLWFIRNWSNANYLRQTSLSISTWLPRKQPAVLPCIEMHRELIFTSFSLSHAAVNHGPPNIYLFG